MPFALDHAIACGASPKATNGLPLIDAAWRFKADTQGVQIYAEGSHFKDIEMFLSKAFGEPDASKGSKPTVQQEKGPWKSFGAYSVRDIGAGIQYFGNDKQCGLIIIRSQGHPIAR